MPAPGPNSPTKALEAGPRSLPSALAADDDLSKIHLTADEVRRRLVARERDIQYHLDALKHETLSVLDDVNIDGRPLMDRIRQRPEVAVALAAGTGALLGVLLGVRARWKRRPETADHVDFVQARLAVALDEAAHRVAQGAEVETAIRRSMEAVPVAYSDGSGAAQQARSSTREAVDVAVKTAVGFGVKALMDVAIRRYTGHDGTIDALTDD